MRVLISSWKRQDWLIPICERYWRRAWPECAWSVKSVSTDKMWSDQMLDWLSGEREPFLLLLNDYIVTKVDKTAMLQAAAVIELEDVATVRLVPMPTRARKIKRKGWAYPLIGERSRKEEYSLSLQAAMWKPEVLRGLLRAGENPWRTELAGSQRVKAFTNWHFMGSVGWAIRYKNALQRGQLQPDVRRWLQRRGVKLCPGQ